MTTTTLSPDTFASAFPLARPPAALRFASRLGDAALEIGFADLPLVESELMAAAERRTGLGDWGDTGFREALGVLLDSARDDAKLNFVGRLSLRNALTRALMNRLRFVAEAKRHPSALARAPRRPIIIAAPPRTGSTLLQRLLAAHPDALSLPLWMAMEPFPAASSEEWKQGGSSERLARARSTARLTDLLMPAMKRLHETGPTLPVECTYLMLPVFASVQWWSIWPLYSYADWLVRQDGGAAYANLRAQLSLLQRDLPGTHWVLKAPGHFTAIRDLHRAFAREKAGALIVQLHRDPARVIPSVCSMMAITHRLQSNAVDFGRTSEALLEAIAMGGRRSVALRQEVGDKNFLDLAYRELAASPLLAARKVCERAEMRWDAEVEAALKGYLDAHPRGRHGGHAYPERFFDLDPRSIRARFSEYLAYFDVDLEEL